MEMEKDAEKSTVLGHRKGYGIDGHPTVLGFACWWVVGGEWWVVGGGWWCCVVFFFYIGVIVYPLSTKTL